MRLFRTMLQDDRDGLPVVGSGAKMLGVRVPPDTHPDITPDSDGLVRPRTGGMSVTADDPLDMHPRMLPEGPRFRGYSKRGAVYEMDAAGIVAPLTLNDTDPEDPDPHRVVEPKDRMALEEYSDHLEATRESWRAL